MGSPVIQYSSSDVEVQPEEQSAQSPVSAYSSADVEIAPPQPAQGPQQPSAAPPTAPAQPRPLPTVSAAPAPSLFQRARQSVGNSIVGHSLEQATPGIAQALGLQPTESEASPTYRQNEQSGPQLPAWVTAPTVTPERILPGFAARRLRANQQQFQQAHPVTAGVLGGITDTLSGLTSPENLALLTAAPEAKPVSAFFAAQAGKGAYQNAEQAYQAWRAGKNPDAAKFLTEAGLNTVIAGLVGHSALHGAFPVDTARPRTAVPPVEIPPEPKMLPAPREEAPEGAATPPEPAPAPAAAPGASYTASQVEVEPAKPTGKMATAEAALTGKPIEGERPAVQKSNKPAELRKSAAEQKPDLQKMAENVAAQVPGAEVMGPRVKAAESIENKEERGKAPESNIDNLGVRVIAPNPDAVPAVQAAVERNLPVVQKDTITNNGLDVPQYGVKTGAPGEPNQVSELQIPTAAEAEAMKDTDHLYAKQKEAMVNGDKAKADEIGAQIQQRFDEARASESKPKEGGGGPTPELSAGAAHPAAPTEPTTIQTKGEVLPPEKPGPLTKGTEVTLPDGGKGTIQGGNPNFSEGGRWSVQTAAGTKTFKGTELRRAEATESAPAAPGAPIQPRIDQIKQLAAGGTPVKIFTARAGDPRIKLWLDEHGLGNLPVTNVKGHDFGALIDNEVNVPTNQNEPFHIPPVPAGKTLYVDLDGTLAKEPGGSGGAPTERRTNIEQRKRVEQMTPEEMKRSLLTSEKTGLPNRRAFDEAQQQKPAPAVAMSDADGLKAFNDRFGYDAGDELLRAKAEALQEAGLEAYHDKGDEFLYRGDSPDDLETKLERAREILKSRVFDATEPGGAQVQLKGVDFSHGAGTDLKTAESALKSHKSERESQGARARGELGAGVEVKPKNEVEAPAKAEGIANEQRERTGQPTAAAANRREGEEGHANEIAGNAPRPVGEEPESGAEVRGRNAEGSETAGAVAAAGEKPGGEENAPKEIEPSRISAQIDFPPPREMTDAWKRAANNPRLAEQFKRTGLGGFTVEAPYQFEKGEQGNISKRTGRIRISANAVDPEHTLAHELAHDIYDRLGTNEKEAVGGYMEGNPQIEKQHAGGLEEKIADHFANVLQGKENLPDAIHHAFFESPLRSVSREPESQIEKPVNKPTVRSWDQVREKSYGSLTDKDDLRGMVAAHGDRMIVVKDVNGGRHSMPASVAADLMQNKRFDGNVGSIFLPSAPHDIQMKPPSFDGYILNYLPEMARGIVEARPDLRQAVLDAAPGLENKLGPDRAQPVLSKGTARQRPQEAVVAKHKFGNTQADIPPNSDAGRALAKLRNAIDPADLMGDGLIKDAHITVRYGIDGEDTAGIRSYLEKQAPFEATLGKTQAFKPSEHSDGAAPIVVPVESVDLRRMEKELDKHGKFIERSFPEYKPHATVAYVKPDEAKRYTGMDEAAGKKFKVDSVTISKKDGSTEEVKLGGASKAQFSAATRAKVEPGPPQKVEHPSIVKAREARTAKAEKPVEVTPEGVTRQEGVEDAIIPKDSIELKPPPGDPRLIRPGFGMGKNFEGKYLQAALEPAKAAWDKTLAGIPEVGFTEPKTTNGAQSLSAQLLTGKYPQPTLEITRARGRGDWSITFEDYHTEPGSVNPIKVSQEIGRTGTLALAKEAAEGRLRSGTYYDPTIPMKSNSRIVKGYEGPDGLKELKPSGLKADKLIVQVPGDGRFTIPNNPAAIEGAIKKADNFVPTGAAKPNLRVPKAPAEFDNAKHIANLKRQIEESETDLHRAQRDPSLHGQIDFHQEQLDAAKQELAEAEKLKQEQEEPEAALTNLTWQERSLAAIRPLGLSAPRASAEVRPVTETEPTTSLVLNADAYAVVQNKIGFLAGQHWDGIILAKEDVDALVQKLNAKGVESGSIAGRRALSALAAQMSKAVSGNGLAILYAGEPRSDTVQEEQLHGWQISSGVHRSEAIQEAVLSSPAGKEIDDALGKAGYPRDKARRASEVAAKAVTGEMLKDGFTEEQRTEILGTYFDAVAEAIPKSLEHIPQFDKDVRTAIESAKEKNGTSGRLEGRSVGDADGRRSEIQRGDEGGGEKTEPLTQLAKGERGDSGAETRTGDRTGLTKLYSGFGDPELFKQLFPDVAQRIADWIGEKGGAGEEQRAMMRETRGRMDRRVAIAIHMLKDAAKSWRLRSREDSMKFWNAIESGRVGALSPKDQELAVVFRNAFDQQRDAVQELKPEALRNYIENYYGHIWKKPSVVSSSLRRILTGKRPFAGSAAFLKARTFPTMQDGIDAGFEPATWNPVDMFLMKYAEQAQFLMAHQTIEVMKSAGTAKFVRIGRKAPDGWMQLDDRIGTVYGREKALNEEKLADATYDKTYVGGDRPIPSVAVEDIEDATSPVTVIRGHYYAPAEAAKVFNNFVSKGIAGRSQIYDAANWMNQNLNALQLGISAFHASTTTMSAATSDVALGLQQLAAGKPFKAGVSLARGLSVAPSAIHTIVNGSLLLRQYLEPGSYAKMQKEAAALATAGGRVRQNTLQLKPLEKIANAWRNGAVTEGLTSIPGAILHTLVAPVMEFYVPRMKLGAFYAMAHDILDEADRHGWQPEKTRHAVQEAWDSIDNRFGQVVYDNLFWHKGTRDALQLATRSVGWNFGSVREIGGGAADTARAAAQAASGKMPRVSPRMAFALALPMVSALVGGLLTYLWTGQPPQNWKDYFYPKTANGERHSIPGYMKDVFSFFHDPVRTALNKLAPIWQSTAEAIENRDFYGTEIRHKDDPAMKQLIEFSAWAAKQAIPFSFSGAAKLLTERGAGPSLSEMLHAAKEHPGDVALGQLGFQPAPASIQNTAAMNLAREYAMDNRPPGTKTQDQAAHFKALDAVTRMYREDAVDQDQIDKYMDQGILTDREVQKAERESDEDPLYRVAKNLSIEQLLNVWTKADQSEQDAIEPLLWKHERDIDRIPDDEERQRLYDSFDKALGGGQQESTAAPAGVS